MASSRYGHIVVAIDGSTNSEEALAAAIDLAGQYHSELTILTVAPLIPVYLPTTGPYMSAPIPRSDAALYQGLVDAAVKKAQDAGVRPVTGVCLEGVVVDEILGFLERTSCDLVVVGSRGLSVGKRLLIGSISSALVTHAPCPVLVERGRTATKPSG